LVTSTTASANGPAAAVTPGRRAVCSSRASGARVPVERRGQVRTVLRREGLAERVGGGRQQAEGDHHRRGGDEHDQADDHLLQPPAPDRRARC
jgi:hypothetical protein